MPPPTHTSNNHESESEEDLDYVPEGEEQDSDASEDRDAKRPRVQGSPRGPQGDPAAAKIERQTLWAKFQDSVNASSSSSPAPPESEPKRTVKIEKRHRFAGEDVVEIVEVPEDSADAKRWPLWKSPTDGHDEAAAAPKNGDSSGVPIPLTDTTEALPPTSSSSSSPAATATGTLQPQSQPQPQTQTQTQSTMTTTKRPGRRKPKTQLAEVPAASDSHKGKGKKLTTLEKSALDWNAHVHSSGAVELASELEANRRGGGYLEKVEFLQRVGDRKNEALEANSDHKRRRG